MIGFTLDQLQSFVHGEADAKLTNLIEETMANDLQLAERIAFMQETKLAYETKQLASILDEVSEANPAQPIAAPATPALPIKWILSTAAGILLLAAIWFFNSKKDSVLALDEFMQAPLGLPTTMGSTTQYEFMDAMVDYKAGNMAAANRKWQSQLKANQSDTLHYFLAATHFVEKEYEKANSHYQQVVTVDNSNFRSQSYWYLALIALQEKKYTIAKEYLAKTEHPSKSTLLKRIP